MEYSWEYDGLNWNHIIRHRENLKFGRKFANYKTKISEILWKFLEIDEH